MLKALIETPYAGFLAFVCALVMLGFSVFNALLERWSALYVSALNCLLMGALACFTAQVQDKLTLLLKSSFNQADLASDAVLLLVCAGLTLCVLLGSAVVMAIDDHPYQMVLFVASLPVVLACMANAQMARDYSDRWMFLVFFFDGLTSGSLVITPVAMYLYLRYRHTRQLIEAPTAVMLSLSATKPF